MAWDIAVGETLIRRELHDRWGGGRYGGMEPSVKAESVFLFSNPKVGSAFGYNFDGWHSDGCFHYTGDGQEGDQSLRTGGNKSLMDAAPRGRSIRVFRSQGTQTTYLGEFGLSEPPYYRADAPDRNGEVRSVLVFRLEPLGNVLHEHVDDADTDVLAPEELSTEANNLDQYAAQRLEEPPIAVRREALLVQRYIAWLDGMGETTVRHRVPIPGGGHLFTDLFNKATGELVEAKASAARMHVHAGFGRLLDYSRFVDHQSRALLLPVRPSDDLIALLHDYEVAAIWEEGVSFKRSRSS
jgi:hypothetical protein